MNSVTLENCRNCVLSYCGFCCYFPCTHPHQLDLAEEKRWRGCEGNSSEESELVLNAAGKGNHMGKENKQLKLSKGLNRVVLQLPGHEFRA